MLTILGIFLLTPIVWVVVCSFENPMTYIGNNIFIYIDKYLSLGQYRDVLLYDLEYWTAYRNTILLTLPTITIAVCIVSMAAYGLTVINVKVQDGIMLIYAVLSLMPMQMLLVPHLIALSSMNLNGTRLAVILVGCSSPWYVFFFQRLCKNIPKEAFEAARIEGAGEWTIFRKIAIPQMKLGMMIFGVVISADLWGMVEEPLVYIQDPSKYPLSVWFHETGISISYAGVLLFSLPMVLIFFTVILETLRGDGTV